MNADRPRSLSPTAVTLLAISPLMMLVGRMLAVPFDDQDWDGVLTQAAAHQGRSDVGWLLVLAACGMLAVCAGTLAQLLRGVGRAARADVVAVTTTLGWAGAAGISVAGLVFSVMGQAPQRAVHVQVLKDLNAGSTQFVFLLCVIAAVGYVVLARGLAGAGLVSRSGAALVGLGGVGTLLCVPGPVPALGVLFALLLLAGHVMVVRSAGASSSASPMVDGELART